MVIKRWIAGTALIGAVVGLLLTAPGVATAASPPVPAGDITLPAGYIAHLQNAELEACDPLTYGYQIDSGPLVTVGSKVNSCNYPNNPTFPADQSVGPFATAVQLRIFLTDDLCPVTYFSDGTGGANHAAVGEISPTSFEVSISDSVFCSETNADIPPSPGQGNLNVTVSLTGPATIVVSDLQILPSQQYPAGVPGASVTVSGCGNAYTGTTGASGSTQITVMSGCTYSVGASIPSGWMPAPSSPNPTSVNASTPGGTYSVVFSNLCVVDCPQVPASTSSTPPTSTGTATATETTTTTSTPSFTGTVTNTASTTPSATTTKTPPPSSSPSATSTHAATPSMTVAPGNTKTPLPPNTGGGSSGGSNSALEVLTIIVAAAAAATGAGWLAIKRR